MTCSGEKPSAAVAPGVMQFHVRRTGGGSSAGRQSRVPRTVAAHRPAVCDRRAREFHSGPAPRSDHRTYRATRAARENLCRFDDDQEGEAPGGECTRTPVGSRAHRTLRSTKRACACVIYVRKIHINMSLNACAARACDQWSATRCPDDIVRRRLS